MDVESSKIESSKIEPPDAAERRAVRPIIVYPLNNLSPPDLRRYRRAREGAHKTDEIVITPRQAGCFEVEAGRFFRITCIEGPQVGDLNLWNAHDIGE